MKTIHAVGVPFSIDRQNEDPVDHPPVPRGGTSDRRFLGLMVLATAACLVGAALLLLSLGRALMFS